MTSSFNPTFQPGKSNPSEDFKVSRPYRPYVFKTAGYYTVEKPDMSDFDERVPKQEATEEINASSGEGKNAQKEEHRQEADPARLRAEAEKLLEDARVEAEKIRQEAHDQGYREGLDKGHEDGLNECSAAYADEIRRFHEETKKALDEISETREKIVNDYIGELRDIAVNVAEKVIHVSLKTSGKVIEKMISEEAESHKKTEWIKIYIDREDYNLLAKTDADMARELSRITDNIRFVVMDGEKQGCLVMESPEEIVDMSVDTQMNNIRDKLRGVILSTGENGQPADDTGR